MSLRSTITAGFQRTIERAARIRERSARDRHNLDVVLHWALQRVGGSQPIRFPVEFVELLRSCLERVRLSVVEVKRDAGAPDDLATRRFTSMLEALREVPPVEFATAEAIALVADSYRGNHEPIELRDWTGDVRSHFEISSSEGIKGRILTTVVRFTRSSNCLELGTAYGMSAIFILEALRAHGADTRLTTLEGYRPLFALSSRLLTDRYGSQIACRLGSTQDTLPALVHALGPLDLVFHDAGHSRDDYVRDFQAVLPNLADGALVLIDDIRWESGRFVRGDPKCYEGWLELVRHPRVRRAAEINETMGALLIGGN